METLKKFVKLIAVVILVVLLSACGSDGVAREETTAEGLISALEENVSTVGRTVVYDENTDPNENLGRPGNYIGKASFEDTRVESFGDDYSGGTIEVFSSKSDCNDRYNYLSKLLSPDLGVFGLNQYMYKYDYVVFRVTYDLTPTQAKEYEDAMNVILGETAKTP